MAGMNDGYAEMMRREIEEFGEDHVLRYEEVWTDRPAPVERPLRPFPSPAGPEDFA